MKYVLTKEEYDDLKNEITELRELAKPTISWVLHTTIYNEHKILISTDEAVSKTILELYRLKADIKELEQKLEQRNEKINNSSIPNWINWLRKRKC